MTSSKGQSSPLLEGSLRSSVVARLLLGGKSLDEDDEEGFLPRRKKLAVKVAEVKDQLVHPPPIDLSNKRSQNARHASDVTSNDAERRSSTSSSAGMDSTSETLMSVIRSERDSLRRTQGSPSAVDVEHDDGEFPHQTFRCLVCPFFNAVDVTQSRVYDVIDDLLTHYALHEKMLTIGGANSVTIQNWYSFYCTSGVKNHGMMRVTKYPETGSSHRDSGSPYHSTRHRPLGPPTEAPPGEVPASGGLRDLLLRPPAHLPPGTHLPPGGLFVSALNHIKFGMSTTSRLGKHKPSTVTSSTLSPAQRVLGTCDSPASDEVNRCGSRGGNFDGVSSAESFEFEQQNLSNREVIESVHVKQEQVGLRSSAFEFVDSPPAGAETSTTDIMKFKSGSKLGKLNCVDVIKQQALVGISSKKSQRSRGHRVTNNGASGKANLEEHAGVGANDTNQKQRSSQFTPKEREVQYPALVGSPEVDHLSIGSATDSISQPVNVASSSYERASLGSDFNSFRSSDKTDVRSQSFYKQLLKNVDEPLSNVKIRKHQKKTLRPVQVHLDCDHEPSRQTDEVRPNQGRSKCDISQSNLDCGAFEEARGRSKSHYLSPDTAASDRRGSPSISRESNAPRASESIVGKLLEDSTYRHKRFGTIHSASFATWPHYSDESDSVADVIDDVTAKLARGNKEHGPDVRSASKSHVNNDATLGRERLRDDINTTSLATSLADCTMNYPGYFYQIPAAMNNDLLSNYFPLLRHQNEMKFREALCDKLRVNDSGSCESSQPSYNKDEDENIDQAVDRCLERRDQGHSVNSDDRQGDPLFVPAGRKISSHMREDEPSVSPSRYDADKLGPIGTQRSAVKSRDAGSHDVIKSVKIEHNGECSEVDSGDNSGLPPADSPAALCEPQAVAQDLSLAKSSAELTQSNSKPVTSSDSKSASDMPQPQSVVGTNEPEAPASVQGPCLSPAFGLLHMLSKADDEFLCQTRGYLNMSPFGRALFDKALQETKNPTMKSAVGAQMNFIQQFLNNRIPSLLDQSHKEKSHDGNDKTEPDVDNGTVEQKKLRSRSEVIKTFRKQSGDKYTEHADQYYDLTNDDVIRNAKWETLEEHGSVDKDNPVQARKPKPIRKRQVCSAEREPKKRRRQSCSDQTETSDITNIPGNEPDAIHASRERSETARSCFPSSQHKSDTPQHGSGCEKGDLNSVPCSEFDDVRTSSLSSLGSQKSDKNLSDKTSMSQSSEDVQRDKTSCRQEFVDIGIQCSLLTSTATICTCDLETSRALTSVRDTEPTRRAMVTIDSQHDQTANHSSSYRKSETPSNSDNFHDEPSLMTRCEGSNVSQLSNSENIPLSSSCVEYSSSCARQQPRHSSNVDVEQSVEPVPSSCFSAIVHSTEMTPISTNSTPEVASDKEEHTSTHHSSEAVDRQSTNDDVITSKADDELEKPGDVELENPCADTSSYDPAPANTFCEHCGINFNDEVLHSIHMGCHSHRGPFICNVCGRQCANKYGFNTHIIRGHQSPV